MPPILFFSSASSNFCVSLYFYLAELGLLFMEEGSNRCKSKWPENNAVLRPLPLIHSRSLMKLYLHWKILSVRDTHCLDSCFVPKVSMPLLTSHMF